MKRSLDTKRLILLLLLLALTVAVTALIRVDCGFTRPVGKSEVPAGTYATLGDVCIYLSALLIGGPWAAVVSALGCAIADLCVGSYSYIIGTLIIKAGMALFLGKFAPLCDSWKKCFVVAAIAEGIMIVGYFLFDLLVCLDSCVLQRVLQKQCRGVWRPEKGSQSEYNDGTSSLILPF